MAAVLQHFDIPDGTLGSVTAACKHCKAMISGHVKTTSNFMKHLKVGYLCFVYKVFIHVGLMLPPVVKFIMHQGRHLELKTIYIVSKMQCDLLSFDFCKYKLTQLR